MSQPGAARATSADSDGVAALVLPTDAGGGEAATITGAAATPDSRDLAVDAVMEAEAPARGQASVPARDAAAAPAVRARVTALAARQTGPFALPSTIVTDASGTVLLSTPGVPTLSQIRKTLREIKRPRPSKDSKSDSKSES